MPPPKEQIKTWAEEIKRRRPGISDEEGIRVLKALVRRWEQDHGVGAARRTAPAAAGTGAVPSPSPAATATRERPGGPQQGGYRRQAGEPLPGEGDWRAVAGALGHLSEMTPGEVKGWAMDLDHFASVAVKGKKDVSDPVYGYANKVSIFSKNLLNYHKELQTLKKQFESIDSNSPDAIKQKSEIVSKINNINEDLLFRAEEVFSRAADKRVRSAIDEQKKLTPEYNDASIVSKIANVLGEQGKNMVSTILGPVAAFTDPVARAVGLPESPQFVQGNPLHQISKPVFGTAGNVIAGALHVADKSIESAKGFTREKLKLPGEFVDMALFGAEAPGVPFVRSFSKAAEAARLTAEGYKPFVAAFTIKKAEGAAKVLGFTYDKIKETRLARAFGEAAVGRKYIAASRVAASNEQKQAIHTLAKPVLRKLIDIVGVGEEQVSELRLFTPKRINRTFTQFSVRALDRFVQSAKGAAEQGRRKKLLESTVDRGGLEMSRAEAVVRDVSNGVELTTQERVTKGGKKVLEYYIGDQKATKTEFDFARNVKPDIEAAGADYRKLDFHSRADREAAKAELIENFYTEVGGKAAAASAANRRNLLSGTIVFDEGPITRGEQVIKEVLSEATAEQRGKRFFINDRPVTKTEFDFFRYLNNREIQLGIDPLKPDALDDYRDLLEMLTGKRSTLELSKREARYVIEELNYLKQAEGADLFDTLRRGLPDRHKTGLGSIVDHISSGTRIALHRGGYPGRRMAVIMQGRSRSLSNALGKAQTYFEDLFRGIPHHGPEDYYIGLRLAGKIEPNARLKDIAPLVGPRMGAKVASVAGDANLEKVVEGVRKWFGTSEDTGIIGELNRTRANIGLPPIKFRDNYLTSLGGDASFTDLTEVQKYVPEVAGKSPFRFAMQRRKDITRFSTIDAVNAYLPAALKHKYFAPVLQIWKNKYSKMIPDVLLRRRLDDWVRYASGLKSGYEKQIEALLTNFLEDMRVPSGTQNVALKGVRAFSRYVTQYIYAATLGGTLNPAIKNSFQAYNALLQHGPVAFSKAAAINFLNAKWVTKLHDLAFGSDEFAGFRRSLGKTLEGEVKFPLFNPKEAERIHELVGTEHGGLFKLRTPIRGATEKAVRAFMYPMEATEAWNRRLTVTTSLIDSFEKGLSWKDAVRIARQDLEWQQFDFSAVGQPGLFRGTFAKPLFQYARFPIQQTAFYVDKLSEGAVGLTKLPGAVASGSAREIYSALQPVQRLAVYAGVTTGVIAGISLTTGRDFSNAMPGWVVSMGKSMLSWAGVDKKELDKHVMEGEGFVGAVAPRGGPIVSVIEGILASKDEPSVIGVPWYADVFVPVLARNFIKAYRVSETGEWRTRNEQFLAKKKDGDILGMIGTLVGTRSTVLEYRRVIVNKINEVDNERQQERRDQADHIAILFRRGKVDEAKRYIMDHYRDTVDVPSELEPYVKFAKDGRLPLWGSKEKPRFIDDMINLVTERVKTLSGTLEEAVANRISYTMRTAFGKALSEGFKSARSK